VPSVRWMLALALVTSQAHADQACRQEADGRISCEATGFRMLTDAVVNARSEAKQCGVLLADKSERLSVCEQSLLADPVPPAPVVEQSPVMRMVGLGLGVLAASALTVSITLPSADAPRMIVGGISIVAIATSVVMVSW